MKENFADKGSFWFFCRDVQFNVPAHAKRFNGYRILFLFIVLLTCVSVFNTSAALSLASPFGDHMVLQRRAPVPVWGSASGSATITVTINSQTKSAKASDGKWKVVLDPMEAGGPYEMTISGDGTKTIKDVLIGEVWIASGQSNMHQGMWPSRRWDNIRHLIVSRTDAGSPKTSVDCAWYVVEARSGWPQNTDPGFSKVAMPFSIYLHQALGVPVGILSSSSGSSWVSEWMDPWALETAPAGGDKNPGSHFNGMINPLIPYAIKGAIWWQGEWDARVDSRGGKYHQRFPWMIMGWRRLWDQGDFPFYYVQLQAQRSSTSASQTVLGETRGYTITRERMRQSMALVNTGMVVSSDVAAGLHPGAEMKDSVARRLSYWALAKDYGKTEIVPGAPMYKDMQISGSEVTLNFDYADGGLKLAAPVDDLHGFVIAAKDGIFHPAEARVEGASVIVKSSAVTAPAVVRYAWLDAAAEDKLIKPVLTNGAGLPASLFSTDSGELEVPKDQIVDIALQPQSNVLEQNERPFVCGASMQNCPVFDIRGRRVVVSKRKNINRAIGLYISTMLTPIPLTN
jgi:sialate O-acetylesterase